MRRQGTKGFNIAREPEGQQCLEAFGTGEIGCSPDLAEGFKEKVRLVESFALRRMEDCGL